MYGRGGMSGGLAAIILGQWFFGGLKHTIEKTAAKNTHWADKPTARARKTAGEFDVDLEVVVPQGKSARVEYQGVVVTVRNKV